MIKRKRKILILGSIIIALTAIFGVYIFLAATGVVHASVNDLVIKSADISREYNGKLLTNADEKYSIISGNLHDGHKIVTNYYSQIKEAGQVPNEMTVEILDANNQDVSREYNLTVNFGYLTVNKRSIKIETASDAKPYDGTPLSKDSYEITRGSIVLGEEEEIRCYSEITEIGSINNECNVSIVNQETKEDVTKNYDIEIQYGTLEIGRREMKVSSESKSKEYDGMAFETSTSDFSITEGSFINPTHQIKYLPEIEGTIDAGVYSYKFTCQIFDEEGRDVSSSYHFTYDYGTITINPRNITISLINQKKLYDTNPIYDSDNKELAQDLDYKLSKDVVEGDSLIVYSSLSRDELINTINAGTYKIDSLYKLATNNKDNYKIESLKGEYVVNKAPVTIKSKNGTKLYNGKPYYEEVGWQLSESEYTIDGEIYGATVKVYNDMTAEELDKTKNKGLYSLKIKAEIYENEELSSNFDIKCEAGELNVDKYRITVTVANQVKIYDRQPLYSDDNHLLVKEKDYKNTELLEGTRLEVYSKLQGEMLEKTKDVTSNFELDVDCKLLDENNNDISDNFEINSISGKLTVNKRDLFINILSQTKEYDGKSYDKFSQDNSLEEKKDYEISPASNLLENTNVLVKAELKADELGKTKNAGQYNLKATASVLYLDIDESDNYNIVINFGKLTVLKKTTIVSTNNVTKEYDGNPYYNDVIPSDDYEFNIIEGDLVTLDLVTKSKDSEPGKYKNDAEINNVNGSDSINYEFILNPGSITITKLNVIISFKEQRKIIENNPILESNATIDEKWYKVNSNSDISVIVQYNGEEINKIGKYELNETNLVPKILLNETDITAYCKTNIFGNDLLVVKKALLEVNSVSKSYDGKAYIENSAELDKTIYSFKDLESDHSLSITYIGEDCIEPGEYDFKVLCKIVDENNNDVTELYDISYRLGQITIKYDITVKFDNVAKIYDGQAFYEKQSVIDASKYTVNNPDFAYSLIYNGDSYKNAGTYDVKLALKVFKDGTDITNKCDIKYENEAGVNPTMTIGKRDISIYTGSASKYDDGTPLSCKKIFIDGNYVDIENKVIPTLDGVLVAGDKLLAIEWSKLEAVGQCANFVLCRVLDSNDNDVSKNYDISVTTGLLEIYGLLSDRNEIKVSPVKQSVKWQSGLNALNVFDPNGMVIGISEFENAGLQVDYSLSLEHNGTEAGRYKISINKNTFKLLLNGTDVTENYSKKIKFEDDYLYWYLYDITITTQTKIDNIYKGTLSGGNVILGNGNLATGHQIITTKECSLSSIGMIMNRPTYKIVDEFGKDVTYLYNIKESFGKLQINGLKEITIEFNLDNGLTSSVLDDSEYTVLSLASEDRITITLKDNVTRDDLMFSDAYEDLIDVKIINGNNVDVTDCYDIEYLN